MSDERFRLPILSHADALAGGHALYDRWVAMTNVPPLMGRGDPGWADMFRHAYEAIAINPKTG